MKTLLLIFAALAALVAISFSPPTAVAEKKPNVVIIFMDDMGYGDLECYAGSPWHTPNLNRLAADGMRFTYFYAAQAVCSASRAGLLTGCYPNRIGISGALWPTAPIVLDTTEQTIANLLKDQGYRTGMVGKWHLGAKAPWLPLQHGFDEYLGLPYSNDMWPVKEEGLDNNTLVVFTSDNGPWLSYGNHAGNTGGLREGKGTSWEGGIRVPCIMKWPGKIPAGTVCNKMAATIDLLPTIAGFCGAKLPVKKIDGVDIRSLLFNVAEANPRDEFAVYYQKNSLEAIRKGPWKLVLPHKARTYKLNLPGYDGFPGDQPEIDLPMALHDMRRDPGETLDVKQQFPEVVKALLGLADKYRKTLGDDLTGDAGTERRPPGKVNL